MPTVAEKIDDLLDVLDATFLDSSIDLTSGRILIELRANLLAAKGLGGNGGSTDTRQIESLLEDVIASTSKNVVTGFQLVNGSGSLFSQASPIKILNASSDRVYLLIQNNSFTETLCIGISASMTEANSIKIFPRGNLSFEADSMPTNEIWAFTPSTFDAVPYALYYGNTQ